MLRNESERRSEVGPVRTTVAIPTRGRPERLCTVVRDICAGDRRPDEILVVCQGEGALDTAHRLNDEVPESVPILRFYASTRRGPNASWNDAIRLAVGEFIAFTDDDMRLPEEWLEEMIRLWVEDWDRAPVLLTGPILAPETASDPSATPGYRPGDGRRVWRSPPLVGDVLFGGHFGAPRDVFTRAGRPPFDERLGPGTRFPGAGDEEFAIRLLRAGVPIAFEPSLSATHVADVDTWIRSQHQHSIGVGASYLIRWSSGERRAPVAAMRTLCGVLLKGLHNFLRLHFREGAGRVAGALGILRGALRWTISAERHEPPASEPGPGEVYEVPLQ